MVISSSVYISHYIKNLHRYFIAEICIQALPVQTHTMMYKTKFKIIVQEPWQECQGQKDLSFLQNACQRKCLVHSYFELDLLYVLWVSSLSEVLKICFSKK